ncbi:MAG: VacJ family lipoprotein [Nitrospinae bacterium]|nr:VacJ family lipoprotein [Nitrospinota bacterium]
MKAFIIFFLLFAATPLFAEEISTSNAPVLNPNNVIESNKDEIEGTISFEMRGVKNEPMEIDEDEDYLKDIDWGIYSKVGDPLEGYNRFMFNFNNGLYEFTLGPLAKGYAAILPSDLRLAISNAFDNIAMPMHLLSSIFQGDGEKAARVLKRFLINTTLGLGGLGDVAAHNFDLPKVKEDMEQALTNNNVAPGSYIVWPIIGPSTAAGTFGKVLDTLLNPVTWIVPDFLTNAAIRSGGFVNDLSFYPELRDKITAGSIDPYLASRDAFLQYRQGLLKE